MSEVKPARQVHEHDGVPSLQRDTLTETTVSYWCPICDFERSAPRCQERTILGAQCAATAKFGFDVCRHHTPQALERRAARVAPRPRRPYREGSGVDRYLRGDPTLRGVLYRVSKLRARRLGLA